MTNKAFVRPSKAQDVFDLAPRLREGDLNELKASSGITAEQALQQGFIISDIPMTIIGRDGETVVAMFGVTNIPSMNFKQGVVWLLGSDGLGDIGLKFARECKQWVDTLQDQYDILWNVVDKRNELHIRWLTWCGFQFMREIPEAGVESKPFYEFFKIKKEK